jgi:glycerol-3-phosphate acyltransferase PlsY
MARNNMFRLPAFMIGYLFGNILFGYLYGKAHDKDIRTLGSGNVGTTNTVRTLGVKPGVLTLLSDCLKVVLAYFVVGLIFENVGDFSASYIHLLQVWAAFGAVLGHDFPFVLKFKGGKGIASSLGFLFVVMPESIPVVILVFIITVFITRYVSLGSILAAATIIIETLVFYFLGLFIFKGKIGIEVLFIVLFLASLAIFLHRSNIKRLINHNENKFTFHPSI